MKSQEQYRADGGYTMQSHKENETWSPRVQTAETKSVKCFMIMVKGNLNETLKPF